MNIAANIPNTPGYQASYKTKNKTQLVLACVWTFTCTLNLIKAYKRHQRGEDFETFDIIWMVCLALYILIIADTLITRVTFSISNGQLSVSRQSLFRKKLTVYEIDQMHHIELEERAFKKNVWFKSKPAIDYAISFSYYEAGGKLTGLPDKEQAEQLLEAILAARV